ncbi:MAG: hypothetical protein JXQ91_07770 [Vannielia sp.]|uniref:hypothetical protein n=1 Tax=Vannielia sp. TaxID=2813045 RepID=UPI003B8BC57E
MTVTEFQAFLEGMNVGDCPTPDQWSRIKKKIDALESLRLNRGAPNGWQGPIYSTNPAPDTILPGTVTC